MDLDSNTNLEIKGNEAVFTRVINAPKIPLFKACTDAVLIPLWWGPHGFESKVCQIDLRTGGSYKVLMRSPEGGEYTVKGTYLEIAPPDRLSFTLSTIERADEWLELLNRCNIDRYSDSESSAKFHVTIDFKELNEKTELKVTVRFGSEAECKSMINYGIADGWGQSLERLSGLIEFFS
jgi:uncharacterized protein YndB with AHSA1/START domain